MLATNPQRDSATHRHVQESASEHLAPPRRRGCVQAIGLTRNRQQSQLQLCQSQASTAVPVPSVTLEVCAGAMASALRTCTAYTPALIMLM